MENMEIKTWLVSDLKPAEYNPRKLSDKQFQDIRNSIEKFGFVDPIIVNINEERYGTIVGGHQRVKVWDSMGNSEVPCVELDLSFEEEKELNIRLNKNSGEFDFELLSEFFEQDELAEWGFDEFELTFDEGEFGEDFDLADGEKEPFRQMTFILADEQADVIDNVIADAKSTESFKYIETYGNENGNGNALYCIFTDYLNLNKTHGQS